MKQELNLNELPEVAKSIFSAIEDADSNNKEIIVNFIASTIDDEAIACLYSLNTLTGEEQAKLMDYFNHWLSVRFTVDEIESINANIQLIQFKLLSGKYAH